MAIHNDYKRLTIDSIRENLIALDFCKSFDKAKSPDWAPGDSGCLGAPALILLGSLIDTMGSYFRETPMTVLVDGNSKQIEKASDHFLILNHDKIFDLRLSQKVIDDFYIKYRSPMTHNNTLPLNVVIDMGEEQDEIFVVGSTGELSMVRLIPLLKSVKEASKIFIYYLQNSNWSEDHKLSIELKRKGNIDFPKDAYPSITASTSTDTSSKTIF